MSSPMRELDRAGADGATEGWIFDIQRFCVHDGPGIRTLIFFKGCPLRCRWCSNPEGQIARLELMVDQDRCDNCGTCVAACGQGAHVLVGGVHSFDMDRCRGHGACVLACPNGTLRMVGSRRSAASVLRSARSDHLFFDNSGGGITLGGGEPTAQPELALALLQQARRLGIHTAMETCGFARWEILESLASRADLVLLDIKHLDAQAHRRGTGVSNETILENARRLFAGSVPLIVRVPIIPGFNDIQGDLEAILDFVASHAARGRVRRIELNPYHRFGVDKYRRLGRPYELAAADPITAEFLQRAPALAEARGLEAAVQGWLY
ncbi:MAG: glycyl-radical enzyme activating protein [Cyanobacteria bacterium NC_groundwater_1444_Ag_S-0.65um_54_12]|nr:glycyl-radical enzyme activating protein [Cyanobacteria bacterium NC_groundwater_1444_Ag_S-0.65um_54_12]